MSDKQEPAGVFDYRVTTATGDEADELDAFMQRVNADAMAALDEVVDTEADLARLRERAAREESEPTE